MTNYGTEWSKHDYYKQDPLPGIEPALLNSRDIQRYVNMDCLLEKDSFDPRRMMPASYGIKFLGTLIHWQEEKDGNLKPQSWPISEGECVKIGKNSISYLWTEECLRLPEYIAARFNFRIREVHRGLLLGTGPMVDPGFGGRILIPLHNLTDNDYAYVGGDVLLWVEFTKVSTNDYWLAGGDRQERPKGLKKFPSEKAIDDPHGYLKKAGVFGAGARGVQSAFKGELGKATRVAEAADSTVKKMKKLFARYSFFGILAALVGVGGLLVSAFYLTFPVMDKVDEQSDYVRALEKRLAALENEQSNGHGDAADGAGTPAIETNLVKGKPGESKGIPVASGESPGPEVRE